MHWADEATLDLLRFVGRRITSAPAVLLATYREDDGPMRLVLGDVATAAGVKRCSLEPLSEGAVRILADGSGFDPVALHRRTGGNPFFVTEVLGTTGTNNSLALPQSVRDAVQARVARLSAAARAVLEACAVVGLRVDVALLAELYGSEADAIDECQATGLLREEGLSLVFRNELGRDAVLEAISPARRMMLHRKVLALLRRRRTAPDDLAQLAHHAEASGDADAVLEFAPAAGRHAASLSAHREAVAQYRRALHYANRLEPETRARLLEELAHEYWVIDQAPAAIETRLLALQEWRSLGNRLRQGDCLRQLARHYWYAARGSEAEQALQQSVEILESLPPGPELAHAYNGRAALWVEDGDWARALPIAKRAIDLAEHYGCVDAVAYGRNMLGCALIMGSDPRGVSEIEASIALAREAGLEEEVVRGFANLTECLGDRMADRDLAVLDPQG